MTDMTNNLITFENPKSRAAEAFRTLRTNIQFSSLDNDIKSIMVTSTAPSEGKSTVILNLAITMAQTGKKILLLDCDLRKPTVHKKLGIPNNEGLTGILIGSAKLEECIVPTKINNLSVLTCGAIPPNPSELLGSKKMKAFLGELEGLFDVVLIDAPPVIVVTDAQIISTFCQGVILVASYGQTEKVALVKAKDLLDKVSAHILGVVVNKVPMSSHSYGYGKYYDKYYSGYYEEDNGKIKKKRKK